MDSESKKERCRSPSFLELTENNLSILETISTQPDSESQSYYYYHEIKTNQSSSKISLSSLSSTMQPEEDIQVRPSIVMTSHIPHLSTKSQDTWASQNLAWSSITTPSQVQNLSAKPQNTSTPPLSTKSQDTWASQNLAWSSITTPSQVQTLSAKPQNTSTPPLSTKSQDTWLKQFR